ILALECGRVVAGAPFLWTSFGVTEALRLWGDVAVKSALLPAFAAGELKGVVAFSEGVGDPIPQQPTVMLVDGRISGTKRWITGAAGGDVALVLVTDHDTG